MKIYEYPMVWGRAGALRDLQRPRARRPMPKRMPQHAPNVVGDPYATQGPFMWSLEVQKNEIWRVNISCIYI